MESSKENILEILKTSEKPLIDALNYRRTIRNFDINYKIPDEELKEIIQAGRNSPTYSNIQPIDFMVIKNQKMLTEISNKIFESLPEDSQKFFKKERNNDGVNNSITCDASVVIILIKNERASWDEYFDIEVGTALMAMMVASLQFGLDTMCLGTFKKEIVEDYFKLPKKSIGLALAIGKAKGERTFPHKELKNKVFNIE